MNKLTIAKTILFGDVIVEEKVVQALLNGEKSFRVLLESLSSHLEELCSVSNVLKKEECTVTQINTTKKCILDYITLLEKALLPIPSNLSTIELINNETVKSRLMARTRLKNMKINGFIQVLNKLILHMEEIILLHNNPNLLYKDAKIDDVDLNILTKRSLVLSKFERLQMHVSVSEFVNKTGKDEEHGVLTPLFRKTRENIEDKDVLVKFETLYDDIQNCISLAEDLLVKDDNEHREEDE